MFHPVIDFPEQPIVLDFTRGGTGNASGSKYTVGRYDEDRSGLYTQEIFTRSARHIHVGIDLGAPAHTPLSAFADGIVIDFAFHSASGDYGPTLITEHTIEGRSLYVLWGHLSRASLSGKTRHQKLRAGEIFAWIGEETENGGWPPHVHIQLSWEKPVGADLPGVVSLEDREEALKKYPDPRLILGSIY